MTTRLMPYGATDHADHVSKVGKKMTSPSLAARMPSVEIAAKVGVTPMLNSCGRTVRRLNQR